MVTFKYKSVANVMRETSMQTFYRIVRQSGPLSANVRRGPRTKHIGSFSRKYNIILLGYFIFFANHPLHGFMLQFVRSSTTLNT